MIQKVLGNQDEDLATKKVVHQMYFDASSLLLKEDRITSNLKKLAIETPIEVKEINLLPKIPKSDKAQNIK